MGIISTLITKGVGIGAIVRGRSRDGKIVLRIYFVKLRRVIRRELIVIVWVLVVLGVVGILGIFGVVGIFGILVVPVILALIVGNIVIVLVKVVVLTLMIVIVMNVVVLLIVLVVFLVVLIVVLSVLAVFLVMMAMFLVLMAVLLRVLIILLVMLIVMMIIVILTMIFMIILTAIFMLGLWLRLVHCQIILVDELTMWLCRSIMSCCSIELTISSISRLCVYVDLFTIIVMVDLGRRDQFAITEVIEGFCRLRNRRWKCIPFGKSTSRTHSLARIGHTYVSVIHIAVGFHPVGVHCGRYFSSKR